jgi:hypothetical protein
MRFVIAESFDRTELNHYFEADIAPRIGERIRSRSGRMYRVQDVEFAVRDLDEEIDVRVLLRREE